MFEMPNSFPFLGCIWVDDVASSFQIFDILSKFWHKIA